MGNIKLFYYAVIFTSKRSSLDDEGYEKMASRMVELAQAQKGFLGMESARGADGNGITVSYWETEMDIAAWKADSEHQLAQEFGRSHWYDTFTVHVCKVEREYSFNRESQ